MCVTLQSSDGHDSPRGCGYVEAFAGLNSTDNVITRYRPTGERAVCGDMADVEDQHGVRVADIFRDCERPTTVHGDGLLRFERLAIDRIGLEFAADVSRGRSEFTPRTRPTERIICGRLRRPKTAAGHDDPHYRYNCSMHNTPALPLARKAVTIPGPDTTISRLQMRANLSPQWRFAGD
jgi:hypothetical protein